MQEIAQLGIVIVRYGTERYSHALVELRTILESIKWELSPAVVVDNADEGLKSAFVSDNVKLIGGDNRYWEFSGWQKGVTELLTWKPNINVLLLVTDAFVNAKALPSDDYARLLHPMDPHICIRNNIVLGLLDPIDYYLPANKRQSYRICNWTFDHWLRTALFYMPTTLYLDLLKSGGMAGIKNVNDFSSKQYTGQLFLKSANFNDEWKNKVQHWLTRDWHSAAPLAKENWPLVKQKLLAILNEHTLSCRLREKGHSLIDLRLLRRIESLTLTGSRGVWIKKLRLTLSLMKHYLPLKDRLILTKYLVSVPCSQSYCNL